MSNIKIGHKEIIPQFVHEVEWNRNKISKYWDVFGNIKPSNPWFSVKASGWLLELVNNIINTNPLQNKQVKILDMGSGSGEFLEFLRKNTGCTCYGVDLSEERVSIAKSQYPNVNYFVGSTKDTGLKSSEFDLIISTQTIEHLLDEDLDLTFREMARLLKNNGTLLLTTRFEEDLTVSKKVCPDCHAIFLHSQHMQSFSIKQIDDLLRKHSITTVKSERSRCRNHVNEFIPKRFKMLNWIIYKLFGAYLDKRIGKYIYSISKKVN
jgi:2-polyprenyl-3-methyl-5-hydroxy-6-metoxy-1,4-benzoquinol methylase